jgi:renalase
MGKVAIVGAGVAGLAAAWALRRAGVDAEVFEASPRIGGRLSTVERGPVRFDDGAQFVRTETHGTETLLLRELGGPRPLNIERDVRPFDRHGAIGAGDPAQNSQPKWVYPGGLRTLAHQLAFEAACNVRLNWRVDALPRDGATWSVAGTPGLVNGIGAVLVTLPPAALRRLLRHSPDIPVAADAVATARHRPILSVAFEPAANVLAPESAYALVNTDRKHAVSWLAFEEAKPGYVPEGRQVLVAQMAAAWSETRLAQPHARIANEAAAEVSKLLGARITPRWWHVTPWAEALPDALLDPTAFAEAERHGVFFAGDGFAGGRVHLAIEAGLAAAERLSG